MSSTQDLEKSRELDDKDDKSSRSSPDDEENVLPSGEQRNVEEPASKDEEKSIPKPEANDRNAIPNGGLDAWLQVLGGFMLFFNTFGVLK
jgi:hypothetical protein